MGIRGKLEVEVEIKFDGDVFRQLSGQDPELVPNITPDKIHTCDLHEGELGKLDSVISWYYTVGNKKCVAKEIVEVIDEENKFVGFKIIEGDLLEEFKSLTISIHVIPRGEITVVKWSAEFEKIADDGPYPTQIIDFCIGITKDIERHHINA
ncbi:MLP-like protein 31 [Chenopodium quinoa]|uniref:MLP-like protein 31 n=1 Tax=Chenopodium quinoa TaxID=63459 RepID=UPI000B796B9D|nr:MLP-like protein 31 [Chenopodium quinoa]